MSPLEPIRANETGTFGDLTARPNPGHLVVLCDPPIDGKLSVLGFKLKRPLNSEEIAVEQNAARAVVVTRAAASDILAKRARTGLS